MFAGDAFYGRVDHVPGLFYVETRFLHYLWLPIVPRESYVFRDDGSGVAVRIPLRWKSVLLAWLRTGLLIHGMTLTVAGVALMRQEPLPRQTHPAIIGAVLWGVVLGLGVVYFFTYRWSRASPDRAVQLGALLDIPRGAVDDRFVLHDAATLPPSSREVASEIAAHVGEKTAATLEAGDEAFNQAMSASLVAVAGFLLACLGLVVGMGCLYAVTQIAGPSRLLWWIMTAVVAIAPLLLFVRRRQHLEAPETFLGESRSIWWGVCCSAWMLGVALSLVSFL